VIFMKPANPEPIKAIFRQIYDAFPLYPPYGGAFGNDLHPHVTVGEFKNNEYLGLAEKVIPRQEKN